MQRLEVLRNLLLLEDFETVAAQWPRLEAARALAPIAAQADWAAYFATVRRRLEQECAELRQNIAESGHDG